MALLFESNHKAILTSYLKITMAMKFSISIFLLFLLTCQNDDMAFDDSPVGYSGLIGEWLLKETYISPGGPTEWQKVAEGHRYIFENDGSYKKTDFNKEVNESGNYEIKEDVLYFYFLTEGEKDTLGFSADFNENRDLLTLSPSYPSVCIEGCLYRFKKE